MELEIRGAERRFIVMKSRADQQVVSSDSDSEVDEPHVHQKLLKTVSALGKKRRMKLKQRREVSGHVSEYHISEQNNGSGGEVHVDDLLSELEAGQRGLETLKKRMKSVNEKKQPLDLPMSKPHAEQVQRTVAYHESSKQVTKWVPIVKHNREADHLSFPLQEDHVPDVSLTAKTDSYTPMSTFEVEISKLVEDFRDVESSDKILNEDEKKTMLEMQLGEAIEHRNEQKKVRALMSYYEQKCRRIKKIKSKKFRRALRKSRKALSNDELNDEEKAERLRALERMTLKHGNTAKWAKKQLMRKSSDPATQQALSTHYQIKTQLKQKSERSVLDSNSCSENSQSESEAEYIPNRHCDTSNPWLSHATGGTKFKTTVHPNLSSMTSLATKHIDTNLTISDNTNSRRHYSKFDTDDHSTRLEQMEAFAGDDVTAEFSAEKREEKVKQTDLTLPGWGSWGGKGIRHPRKRPIKKKEKEERVSKEESTIKHVIINNCQDRKAKKHQVSTIPWPYSTKKQFENTICTPVGRHWNTEAVFQQNIKPNVTVTTGSVIKPLTQTEDVEEFMSRSRRQRHTKT